MNEPLIVDAQISYPIYIAKNCLKLVSDNPLCLKRSIIIISDSNVASLHAKTVFQSLVQKHLSARLFTFPAGEAFKTRKTKENLEDELFEAGYKRDCVIIAVGGGVTTDLAGFIAATYCRGIPIIYVPTSLLAMVDASIGGKTGVNTPHGKNMIGTFTQPHAVFIDPSVLNTLPLAEKRNGVVEMIKHALIADASIFHELSQYNILAPEQVERLEQQISKSCQLKKQIVTDDPEEKSGKRELLNFGHTIGHAIENASAYTLPHGEAVALGIIAESYLATQLGLLSPDRLPTIIKIFRDYQLPLLVPANITFVQLKHQLRMDKKNRNKTIHCVLLNEIGEPYSNGNTYSYPIEESLLNDTLYWLKENFSDISC